MVTGVLGVLLVIFIFWDAFETLILPRSVMRTFRLSRIPNAWIWPAWRALASQFSRDSRRERYLGIYGPMSVILMLLIWAVGLVVGFACIGYGLGSQFVMEGKTPTFWTDLYVSGTTLFTLGLGDVFPAASATRVLTVIEAGAGIAFLAANVTYLPVLYQSFSRREVQITLLDAWAGSPPAAVELIRRLVATNSLESIEPFLKDWERWCSEILESQISYPQVAYFRSQHGRQSWVSSLTTVLDVSAVVLSGVERIPSWQARMTFAIARHAAVDLSQILNAPPRPSARLETMPSDLLLRIFAEAGLKFANPSEAVDLLSQYRKMYEGYITGIAHSLAMELPSWTRDTTRLDNWEATPKKDIEHL